jgi:tartrate-resistant acid phosphatase type 5
MEISVSKEWMKVQFISFDKEWDFDFDKLLKMGGIARGHCYLIPSAKYVAEGAMGQPCKESNDMPIGRPM